MKLFRASFCILIALVLLAVPMSAVKPAAAEVEISFELNASPQGIKVPAHLNDGVPYDLKTHYYVDPNDSKRYIYVFLPPEADLTDVTLQYSNGATQTYDLSRPIRGKLQSTNGNGKMWSYYFIAMKSDLPTLYLNIDEALGSIGAMNGDGSHSTYCYGDMRLDVPETLVKEKGWKPTYYDTMEIRGRGNASWWWEKKPYQIKLGSPQDLLGMGEARTWCLLSNHCDYSLVRNKLALDFAASIGMPYTSKSEFANVFMNGEYLGCYQITEKVHVANNRVEIADKEKGEGDHTGGYLLENDIYAKGESSDTYVPSMISNWYVIRDPGTVTGREKEYVAALMYDIESAIINAEGYNNKGAYYADLFDIDSSVLIYWVNEIFKNGDYGLGSTYYYKQPDSVDSKLYSGPAWDLDCSLGAVISNRGNYERDMNSPNFKKPAAKYQGRINNQATPYGWWLRPTAEVSINDRSDTIQCDLFNHSDYAKRNRELYTEKVRKAMLDLPKKLDALLKQVENAAEMNFARWNNGSVWRELSANHSETRNEELTFLRDYVSARVAWIDQTMQAEIEAAKPTTTVTTATSATKPQDGQQGGNATTVTVSTEPNATTYWPAGSTVSPFTTDRTWGTDADGNPLPEVYDIIYVKRIIKAIPTWMWVVPSVLLVITAILTIIMLRAANRALKMPNPYDRPVDPPNGDPPAEP